VNTLINQVQAAIAQVPSGSTEFWASYSIRIPVFDNVCGEVPEPEPEPEVEVGGGTSLPSEPAPIPMASESAGSVPPYLLAAFLSLWGLRRLNVGTVK